MDKLRQLQLTETDMLRQFDRVCRDHQIPYFVNWGTALGARRHQGFIPWDDDIDIGMLRSDYDKLKKLPEEVWNGLKLVDGYSHCDYHPKVFPRVYKPGTIMEDALWTNYLYREGMERVPVWIDLFLYDHVETAREAKRKARKAILKHNQYFYARYRTNFRRSDPMKRKLISVVKNLLHAVFRHGDPDRFLVRYEKLVRKEKGDYLISFDSWTMKEIMDSLIPVDSVFPVGELPFEDLRVMAPAKVEDMLERYYGDYRKLPPEEKRVGHLPQTLDLGTEA